MTAIPYPLSPRIQTLKGILAKLRPEPVRRANYGSHLTPRRRGMDSNFQYAGAVNLVVAPLCRRKLGTRRCALSVFGQHDALHQSGADPTAEAAIRAGDAQRRILLAPVRKRQRSTG